MKRWNFLFAVFASFALTAAEPSFVIEAETMARTGFYALCASAKASGGYYLDSPQSDTACRGQYEIPRAGNYTVYLRNLSYGDNRRKVAVSIDGKEIGAAGDETHGFIWSRAGEIELTAGWHEIILSARSSNTKPDALLLTQEADAASGEKNAVKLDCLDGMIYQGRVKLNGRAKQAPFETKRCGDKIDFVFFPKANGKPLVTGALSYRFHGDDGQDISGLIPLNGKEITISTTLQKPGFVWCYGKLAHTDGALALCRGRDGKLYNALYTTSAGADVENIPQLAEASDFDEFWAARKKELAQTPLDATLREVKGVDPSHYRTFEVSVRCAGPRPVTGYMVMPRDAKPKSLPANVCFQGYGLHKQGFPNPYGKRIRFIVNAHGMPLGQSDEFYREFFKPLKNYAMHDGADPLTCYFHQMALRVMRSLEFIRTLPEWNGADLVVEGGSQGGLQSIWAAALDDKVTFCNVTVPWNSNLGGEKLGLIKPVGCAVEYFPALTYYSGGNHAKRIKCPVNISRAGLCDTLCPPSSVARLYFNLKCPKAITWIENNDHFAPLPGSREYHYQSDDFPSAK